MTTLRAKLVPWKTADIVAMAVLVGLGLVLLIVSWWAISGTTEFSAHLGWLAIGVGGVVVSALGMGLWLFVGRQRIAIRYTALAARARQYAVAAEGTSLEAGRGGGERHQRESQHDAASLDDGRPVANPRMSRYHRPDCLLVEGKQVKVQKRETHQRAGRRACEVCRP